MALILVESEFVRFDVVNPHPAKPGMISVPESQVKIEDGFTKGRIQCDPTTKVDQPCPFGGEYQHCYLELEDGTACNIYIKFLIQTRRSIQDFFQ